MEVVDAFQSRGGSKFTCLKIDEKGNHWIIRASTGKVLKITARSIGRVKERIERGEEFKFQKNPPDGGLSYTIAIEAALAAICNLQPDTSARVYRAPEAEE